MKFYPYEKGGGGKSFGPAIFLFCSPPLPVINDPSLTGSEHVNKFVIYKINEIVYNT